MVTQLASPAGQFTIRAAQPVDAAPLRQLRLEALASQPEAFAADLDRSAAETPDSWASRITSYAAENSGVICLACADGILVGMAGLARGHWPKTSHIGTIWGVYVSPNWRGLRIGGALLKECAAWGRDHAVTILKLGVVTTNTAAIRCYVRLGFTVYGIDPQAIRFHGADYDELLMAKPI